MALKDIGFVDVWRELHPLKRDYTYFSNPHLLYSRIDYFLIFGRDLHRVGDCSVGIMDLSDHSPLYVKLNLDQYQRNTLWRLNIHTLNHLKDQIKKDIMEFWNRMTNVRLHLRYCGMHVKQC